MVCTMCQVYGSVLVLIAMLWQSQAKDKARVPRWAVVSSVGFVRYQYVADKSFQRQIFFIARERCGGGQWCGAELNGSRLRSHSCAFAALSFHWHFTLAPSTHAGTHAGTHAHARTRFRVRVFMHMLNARWHSSTLMSHSR